MKIELREISIADITKGYINKSEEGVFGFNGELNIRPKYQREFVYKDKQRDAVLQSIMKQFPINVMYWVKNSENSFEVLDGQQRTISICEFVSGKFAINYQYFHNLDDEQRADILNYKILIYICEGTNSEKLQWFETINISGEKLTEQELLNAVYTGTWLTDAKKYFSKTGCPAFDIASDYMSGIPIRQNYLETVLRWINNENIKEYMSKNQHKPNANEIWLYFQSVMNWTKTIFPKYRKEMKGIDWGFLYNQFKDDAIDSEALEIEITKLMQDDDVTKKNGIYEYVLTRDERYLSIRAFTPAMKRTVFERQNGICVHCGNVFEISEMEADHITPWHLGGKTSIENCQMLCKHDNRIKSGK